MFNSFNLFGRSSQWKTARKAHLDKFPFCAACGRKDNLEVHHIIPYQIDKSKELDPNNLITLCGKYCHFVFGHFMDWRSWNPNVIEDSAKYYMAKINKPNNTEYGSSYEKTNINALIGYISNFIWRNNRS